MSWLALTQECREAAEGRMPEPETRPDGRRGKRPASMRVFESPFVERWLARAHPITPGLWFGWVVSLGLYRGIVDFGLAGAGLFFAGVLTTTLIEYTLHRFAFHYDAKSREGRLRVFLMHGYHHEYMDDPMRLVLPPIAIWPIAAVIALVWYLVLGHYWLPVYAGTAAGYVAYDWTHYYTHHFQPKSGIGRWLKRYHMLHHHDSPNHRYGITSPLWDVVFATYLPLDRMVRRAGRHGTGMTATLGES
jgi:sterol desaturase/sphingolipid hydroxylase (fatty acid hydroxylase superfamily)